MSVKFNITDNTASDYVKAGYASVLALVSSLSLVIEGGVSAYEILGILLAVITTGGAVLGLYHTDDEETDQTPPTTPADPTAGFIKPDYFN